MFIANGLNQRGSQVAYWLNPFRSQVTAPVDLGCICTELFPAQVLEFTTEGPAQARPKNSLADCPICDCGDETTPFVSTGLLPQQDPDHLPKPKDFSREHTPGGDETEAYVPGQPEPQPDPAFLASPASPTACCEPGGSESLVTIQTGLEPQEDPAPVVGPKRTK